MSSSTLYLTALLALALTAFSCDKKEEVVPDIQEAVATLYWSGDYAADGCGFSILLNEQIYKPQNEGAIAASFRKEGPMTVEISYVLPGKKIEYVCGLMRNHSERINIFSLKEI
jgi:hypothetical protein